MSSGASAVSPLLVTPPSDHSLDSLPLASTPNPPPRIRTPSSLSTDNMSRRNSPSAPRVTVAQPAVAQAVVVAAANASNSPLSRNSVSRSPGNDSPARPVVPMSVSTPSLDSHTIVQAATTRTNMSYVNFINSLTFLDFNDRIALVGTAALGGALIGGAIGTLACPGPGSGAGLICGGVIGGTVAITGIIIHDMHSFDHWRRNQTQESLSAFITAANSRMEGGTIICPISGKAVVEAFRTPDGTIAEKSELIKYIKKYGRDPVTRSPLQAAQIKADLITIGRTQRAVAAMVLDPRLPESARRGAALLEADVKQLIGQYISHLNATNEAMAKRGITQNSLDEMQTMFNSVVNQLRGRLESTEGAI